MNEAIKEEVIFHDGLVNEMGFLPKAFRKKDVFVETEREGRAAGKKRKCPLLLCLSIRVMGWDGSGSSLYSPGYPGISG